MSSPGLARTAMCFVGFNTFQPLNVLRAGGSFLLQRFGYSADKVGMFVGETNAAISFCLFWGTMSIMVLSSIANSISTEAVTYICPVLSLLTSLAIVLVNIRLLQVYRSCSGEDGLRKLYFWFCMAGLAYSMDMTATRTVTPEYIAEWGLGENLANAFVTPLHWAIRATCAMSCFGVVDSDYHLILWHILTVIFISAFTLLIWGAHVWVSVFAAKTEESAKAKRAESSTTEVSAKPEESARPEKSADTPPTGFTACMESFWRGLSPGLMTVLSLVTVFLIYPAISPYLLVADEQLYVMSLLLLIVSSIGPFIPWILSLNEMKAAKFNTYWTEYAPGYHCIWFLVIPGGVILVIFMMCLHYPEGRCARVVRYKWPAMALGCIYNGSLFTTFTIGTSTIYSNAANVDDKGIPKDDKNGTIVSTVFATLGDMCNVIAVLAAQSYAASYRTYVDSLNMGYDWPTEGKTAFEGCKWWIQLGLRKGFKRFWNIRKLDIVKAIS